MSYGKFQRKINTIAQSAGMECAFSRDDDDTHKYVARFKDGTVIIGRRDSNQITVRWGGSNHNHQAVAAI